MSKKSSTSVKLSENVIEFLKKFQTNRRKTDVDERDISYSRLLGIIVKYFKNDKEKYLEIVGMKEVKHV